MIGRLQRILANRKDFFLGGLESWRERILFAVFGIGIPVSVFVLAATVPVLIAERAWPVLIVDSLVFLIALTIAVAQVRNSHHIYNHS